MYRITATKDGHAELSAELLGEAYETEYTSREEAEEVCVRLTDSASDYGMADVTYEVTEV